MIKRTNAASSDNHSDTPPLLNSQVAEHCWDPGGARYCHVWLPVRPSDPGQTEGGLSNAAQGGTAMKTMLGVCSVFIAFVLADAPAAFAHWPDQAPHQIAQLGEFKLEGGVLKDLKMSYVTHGQLNAAKDNAILFQHGFALNHHQFDHMIGRGRPLDTDKYFIICPDALGATQTRFEHSSSPTNSGLKMKFPFYNGRDMVKAQYRLITETLGISHLRAVTGISSGARYSVQFAVSYPDFMDGIFPIVGGAME